MGRRNHRSAGRYRLLRQSKLSRLTLTRNISRKGIKKNFFSELGALAELSFETNSHPYFVPFAFFAANTPNPNFLFCDLCTTIRNSFLRLRKFLGGQSRELFRAGLARGQKRGDDPSAFFRHHITMSLRHFGDQTVPS